MCNDITFVEMACVGCRSCEQICPKRAITITENKEGFLYPQIDFETCIGCSVCVKHCPAKKEHECGNWPLSVYAFRDKNNERIMNSASGGAGAVAAQRIIEIGGVVYGAAYSERLKVIHIRVNSRDELGRLQSSKYVQSDTNSCYRQVLCDLETGKPVLFTGTPCQIDGLKSFLGKSFDNLYTIDLICHGVPSPKLFEKYVEYQSRIMKDRVLCFNFRAKDKRGWGTQYLLKTETKTKTKLLTLDKYGKHFMNGDCYRECCYQCRYANINRVGDLTIGDFWGIGQSHPEMYSEKGVSSIFINTPKGKELFDRMKTDALVKEVALKEAMIKQSNLVHPTVRPTARDTFYDGIGDDEYIENLKIGLQLKNRIKSILPRQIVSFFKRL